MKRRTLNRRSRSVTFALHQSYSALAYCIAFVILGTGVVLAGYAIAAVDDDSSYPIFTGIGGVVFYLLAAAQLKQWRYHRENASLIGRAEAYERNNPDASVELLPDPDLLDDDELDKIDVRLNIEKSSDDPDSGIIRP